MVSILKGRGTRRSLGEGVQAGRDPGQPWEPRNCPLPGIPTLHLRTEEKGVGGRLNSSEGKGTDIFEQVLNVLVLIIILSFYRD